MIPLNFDKAIIPKVMDSILERTRFVLECEAGVRVAGAESIHCDARKLQLHDLTAIAGLGGPISLLIAFSFERSLLETIFARVAADIEVPLQEVDLYVRDAAAETVNTILGLCTADFENMANSIALSPPVLIEDARCIHRPKNAVFASMRVRTSDGCLSVGIVGPRELFDEWLNYQH
jgi:CheY-specific phosphatase CheX